MSAFYNFNHHSSGKLFFFVLKHIRYPIVKILSLKWIDIYSDNPSDMAILYGATLIRRYIVGLETFTDHEKTFNRHLIKD